MECPKCGNFLDENETSCKNCGAKVKENTLNKISKGGGKTQTPTAEEKAAAQQEAIKAAQAQQGVQVQQVPAQQIQQQNIDPQEYIMLRQQLASAKKSSNLTLAIVVVLIAVVATFGGILLMKKLNPNETKSIREGSAGVTSPTDKKSEDPGENPSTQAEEPGSKKATSTDIEIGSYIFTFPSSYETNFQDGMGISIDYTNKVQFVYTIMNTVSYEEAYASQLDFKEYLDGVGFKVESYQEMTYNNRKWIVFSGVLNEMDAMYAITKMATQSTFQVTIFNLGYKSNSAVLTELGAIVDNAKVKSSTGDSGSSSSGDSSKPSGGSSSGSSGSKPSGGSSGSKPSGGSSQGQPSSGAVSA